MGMFQLSFKLLLNTAFNEVDPQIALKILDDLGLSHEILWSREDIKWNLYHTEIITFLDDVESSWSDRIKLYGYMKSNRLEISYIDEIIYNISFRVDISLNFEMFVRKIIEFALNNGLLIFSSENLLIETNYDYFYNFIVNSNQFKNFITLSASSPTQSIEG